MIRLEAVNLCLRTLGENPVPDENIQYPTLNMVQPAIDDAVAEVLTEGWWFNTRYNVTLVPDVNGDTTVPLNTLMFYPDNARYSFEGTRFIDKDTGALLVDTPVEGRLVTLLPFEDLPDSAQRVVAYTAAYNVYVSDNGVDASAQNINQTRLGFALTLSGQHTRQQRFNSKQKRTVQRYYSNLRT